MPAAAPQSSVPAARTSRPAVIGAVLVVVGIVWGIGIAAAVLAEKIDIGWALLLMPAAAPLTITGLVLGIIGVARKGPQRTTLAVRLGVGAIVLGVLSLLTGVAIEVFLLMVAGASA